MVLDRSGGLYNRRIRRSLNLRKKAVIVDMDGTLVNVASIRHHVRKPAGEKNFDAFHAESIDCPPNQQAIDYCTKHFHQGDTIIVATGREQKWYDVSFKWCLANMPCPFDGPFHARENGDRHSDVVLKKQLYHYLDRNYDIRGAIDDRPEIVQLWRSLGLEVELVPGWEETDG